MPSLIDLFDGRRDCYFDSYGDFTAASSGIGLVWADNFEWVRAFGRHVGFVHDIGVYPRRDDGLCKWGCVDIDTGDLSEALEVWGGLRDAGLEAWIEASGSWKDLKKRGYHVWVFVGDWVDAIYMRALLVEVVRHAGLPDKTEINPKQVKPTAKAVGNCVRLPYGRRSREHPGYSCMTFSPDGEYKDFDVDAFLGRVCPSTAAEVETLGAAALHRQSMRQSVERAVENLRRHEMHVPPFGSNGPSRGGSDQRAWKILNGLDRAEDGERNLCAFVMAQNLRGRGLTLDAAMSQMTVAVQRSFHDGASFVDEAMEVTQRVFRT